MDESKAEATRGARSGRSTKSGLPEGTLSEKQAGAASDPISILTGAYETLAAALQQSWTQETTERAQDAATAFLKEAYDPAATIDIQLRTTEAYVQYLNSLQASTASGSGDDQALGAYEQYQQAVSEAQNRPSAAWSRYTSALQETPANVDASTDAAYRSYLACVKRAFASVSPDDLSLEDFGSIVWNLNAAGNLVASSRAATAQWATSVRAMSPAGAGPLE